MSIKSIKIGLIKSKIYELELSIKNTQSADNIIVVTIEILQLKREIERLQKES